MGKVKSMKSFLRSRRNGNGNGSGNGHHKKNGNGNGNGKRPLAAQKVLFEPLEPRMLLSSDLTYADATTFDLTLRYDEPTQNIQLIDNTTSTSVAEQELTETSSVAVIGSEDSDPLSVAYGSLVEVPGIQLSGVDDLNIGLDSPSVFSGNNGIIPNPSFSQLFYLDLDGEQDVTYEGPVTISDIDARAFKAPDWLQGQETDIIASLLFSLDNSFSGLSVVFTAEKPTSGTEYSTIYIGGDSSAFSAYGPVIGLSEKIDTGNQDHSDNAFIFTDEIDMAGLTAAEFGSLLAGYVGHEAGHLLGFEHAYEIEAGNPLSAVAFKPYSHIQVAKDVRNDLIADGMLTVAGREYAINPLIVEAVRQYASYYYAGSIGPDGFPEMFMGQSVLHSESPGIWVGHIFDRAWQAQKDDTYSPEEKLQILAWSYGYATHVSGDIWSHTLVNELTTGPWPELEDILNFNRNHRGRWFLRCIAFDDRLAEGASRA